MGPRFPPFRAAGLGFLVVTRNLQVSGVGAIPDMPASGDQHGERFPIHRFHDETRVDRRLGCKEGV